MISLDWKERLVQDTIDFFDRKLPQGDYDFDIIYNAYPERIDNKIPRDVVILVASTLATKMVKNHKDYLPFCEYIREKKGENGRLVFACIISKFLRKDYDFYFKYAKNYLFSLEDLNDIHLIIDKIFFPIFKKHPRESIETIITWLYENNDKINQHLIKLVLKIGKNDTEFLKEFTGKLENRWLSASPDFIKICALFLKHLGKLDKERYLEFYRNYKSTREPVFVEILTGGLIMYEEFIYEIYESWSKSGNARLKKAALTGLKFLKKKKG